MKKALLFLVAAAALFLAGCVTIPAQSHQSPAQVAAQVCPQLQAVHDAFAATPGVLTSDQAATLAKAEPIVAKVCADAAAMQSAGAPDLKAVAGSAVPVLLTVIQNAPLPPADKLRITLGVNLAKAVIAQQMAENAAAASAAK